MIKMFMHPACCTHIADWTMGNCGSSRVVPYTPQPQYKFTRVQLHSLVKSGFMREESVDWSSVRRESGTEVRRES